MLLGAAIVTGADARGVAVVENAPFVVVVARMVNSDTKEHVSGQERVLVMLARLVVSPSPENRHDNPSDALQRRSPVLVLWLSFAPKQPPLLLLFSGGPMASVVRPAGEESEGGGGPHGMRFAVKTNSDPLPSPPLVAQASPPISRASERQMLRPNPVPIGEGEMCVCVCVCVCACVCAYISEACVDVHALGLSAGPFQHAHTQKNTQEPHTHLHRGG